MRNESHHVMSGGWRNICEVLYTVMFSKEFNSQGFPVKVKSQGVMPEWRSTCEVVSSENYLVSMVKKNPCGN